MQKLAELNSNTEMEISKPTIPVSIVLQETEELYEWCQTDKDQLIKAGLKWSFVEDIQLRAAALRYAQTKWNTEHKSGYDCQTEWKIASGEGFELRNEIVHNLFHALHNNPLEYAKVRRIDKGGSNADMIQDLSDLSELGLKHSVALEAIGFDLSILSLARKKSTELPELLAKANGSWRESSPALELRNKAHTHLKEAVTEIRRVGQFVFWKNEIRLKGYKSQHVKKFNDKRRSTEESSPD